MNAPALPYPRRFGRTRALDGFDRVAWTVEDFKKMTETGVLDPDAPVELIEGELVPMNAKKNRHEIWKRRLVRLLARSLPDDLAVAIEPSLYISPTSARPCPT